MNIQKQTLTKKRRQIFNILTGQTLYEKPLLNETIFNTDLVLKMKFPLSQKELMIDKNKYVSLDEFIYNPDLNLVRAYQEAYEQLLKEISLKKVKMQISKTEKNIQLRNQVNFQSIKEQQQVMDKKYEAILGDRTRQQVVFPCYVKCVSSVIDCFTLNYNTLIYVLQKKCGFQTASYFVEEKSQGNKDPDAFIYILLTQNTQHLLNSADKFKIKKEIDYSQVDLFLNEPVDQKDRPYQNNPYISREPIQSEILRQIKTAKLKQFTHSKLLKQQQQINPYEIMLKTQGKKNNQSNTTNNPKIIQRPSIVQRIKLSLSSVYKQAEHQSKVEKQKEKQFIAQNQVKQLFKRVHRNMKDKVYKLSQAIIDQERPSQKEQEKIVNYLTEFFLEFDKIMQENVKLDVHQKSYIIDINRGKINPKVQSEYILKLKRKNVFKLLESLSEKHGHQTYKPPISYFPFILPSRHLNFMQRLKGLLLYEEYQVNPYGDYSLFSKTDRIKIAYLSLKQHIRVQNLNKISCTLFALHDDFQRYGMVVDALELRQIRKQVKGGINGVNLLQKWNPLTPWKVDYETVRNYFGEDTAYQVYLKTHLILYFIIITPLGIAGEIIARLFIYYNTHYTQYMDRGFSSTHKQQLAFHILFFALTIGIFAYFYERWLNKQQNFRDNFVENETQSTFRYDYQGPYIRNNITDSVNEYRLNVDTRSLFIKAMGFLLILVILGGQCAFFHGMRMAIVKLVKVFPQTNIYLISWAHIFCYGIFFIFNHLLSKFVITRVTDLLTKLQNNPTEDLHRNSRHSKNSLFSIGVQLIPVIFLLIFEPIGNTSCYSSSCYDQFTQYIYSRYVIVFFFLAIKLLSFLFLYTSTRIKSQGQQSHTYCRQFDQKLLNYIKFIEKQSLKPQYTLSLNDQTEALLHYGIFLVSFPLSPLLGVASMILEYLIEKIELIVKNKRPIPKSQIIEFYSGNYNLIMHLSIFVNCWLIFFTLEQVEYSFQRLVRIFLTQNPTYDGILVLKISIIIVSILVFEIYVLIVRYFVQDSESKMLNSNLFGNFLDRKRRKYEKHILQKNIVQKSKPTLQMHKIHPFRTVFRTYHRQLLEKSKKTSDFNLQQQDFSQQQRSAQFLKIKKQ